VSSGSTATRPPDLLALLPCPLKTPLERAFRDGPGATPGCAFELEGNANHDPAWSKIASGWQDLGAFPDILLVSGFNFLYGRKFRTRFIEKGLYARIPRGPLGPLAAESGLADPEGHYAMICANILVIACNVDKLGSRVIPRGFADLCGGSFDSSVLLRGKAGQWCETTLLGVDSVIGSAGVEGLSRAVLGPAHPSEMIKRLCDPADPAVACIIPWFFSKQFSRSPNIAVVWPCEGAIASPVAMLVKDQAVGRLKDVWTFFVSRESARICEGALFPPVTATGNPPYSGTGPIVWPGWQRIYEGDILEDVEKLQSLFSSSRDT
jgi:hypothetical protein